MCNKYHVNDNVNPNPNDLCSLNNWRPLTLLNTDYKKVTKAIANRIKKFYLKVLILLKLALLRDDILVRISASYKKLLKW